MKYLLIAMVFCLNGAFSLAGNSTSNEENCAHSTQGSNEGAEWNRLLAQLNQTDTDNKKPRPKSTKGQR